MMAAIIFDARSGDGSRVRDDHFIAEVPNDATNEEVDDLVNDDDWTDNNFKSLTGVVQRDR